LRFLASNDYLPSAYVGGMVEAATVYSDTIYAPAAIFLGRHWNGVTASDPVSGAWSQPNAYRTLVHEWAHYALFLYDEYRQLDGESVYCTCNGLPQVRE